MLFTQTLAFSAPVPFSCSSSNQKTNKNYIKMYKFLPLFVLGCVACALAAPATDRGEEKPIVTIIRSEITKDVDGGYHSIFENSDGTFREETAKNVVDEDGYAYLELTGAYSYYNENDEKVVVNYTAGRNGYVPVGTIVNPEISQVASDAQYLPKPEREAPIEE
ncbi:endocuticle structural glycoprotein SgAbd-9 [Drosophila albomicans]|uniref:Endocuticle structural glycoprotein SgAbd-9 n=1 Tax=Drosophila albomicans TaxID=7291 RepID=A0A6P8WWA2_DROAB|nr:endocuticle structural glycoprotein SgAbd-9 [Drosophila albomicans]